MAVKIRLRRMGMKKAPYYRVVVADSRSPRDGRFIESIGIYHPTEEPSRVEIDTDKARDWIAKGAQPSEAVIPLLAIVGITEPAEARKAAKARRTSLIAGRDKAKSKPKAKAASASS
jgi:small subunit ribosomal protein S16